MLKHRLLAEWAADCAERVLPLFAREHLDDDRPSRAIEATRAWARGEIRVGAARDAALAAHAAARETSDPARAAARAAGQAASTPHMADHSLGAMMYAVKAVRLASDASDSQPAAQREYEWQLQHLPTQVRDLVLSALEEGSVLGRWRP